VASKEYEALKAAAVQTAEFLPPMTVAEYNALSAKGQLPSGAPRYAPRWYDPRIYRYIAVNRDVEYYNPRTKITATIKKGTVLVAEGHPSPKMRYMQVTTMRNGELNGWECFGKYNGFTDKYTS
jgi:hypothetical protein